MQSASSLSLAQNEASSLASDDDRALLAISKAVRQNHLTNKPAECLVYRLKDSAQQTMDAEVWENHDRGCGDASQPESLLFTVRMDRKTGSLSTDAGSPGRFHPLKK